MAVVRDHDQGAVVVVQEALQPVDRIQIKVVGRFVQQQRLRIAEQRLGQQHANFLPALQLAHLALVQLIGKVQSLQQQRGVGVGGVAVLFADDALQLAQPHAVVVGQLRLGIDDLALFHGGPQPLVAHDDRVDDAVGVEGKLVLAQHAELARLHHRALLRLQLAGQQLHKGGLTGTVRARQTVTLSRSKRRGHFFEQNFSAVAHGHTGN